MEIINNLNEPTILVLNSMANPNLKETVIENKTNNNINFMQTPGDGFNVNNNNNSQNNNNNMNNINNNINMNQIPNNNFNYQNPNQNQGIPQTFDFNKINKCLTLIISFFKSDQMIKMKMSRNNTDAWNCKENLYLINNKWLFNSFFPLFNTNEVCNILNTNPNILLTTDNNDLIINNIFGMISDNMKQYLNNLDENLILGQLITNNSFISLDQTSLNIKNEYKRVLYDFYFLSEEFVNQLGIFFCFDVKGNFFKTECILFNQKIFVFTNDCVYIGNTRNNFSFITENIIYYPNLEIKNEIMNRIQTDGISCYNFLLFSGDVIPNNLNLQILNINQNSINNNMIIQKLKAFIYFDNFNKKIIKDTENINNMTEEDIVIIKKDLFSKLKYGEIMNIVKKNLQMVQFDKMDEQKQILTSLIGNMQIQDVELLKQKFTQIDFNNINKTEILQEPAYIKSADNKNISIYNDFIVVKKDVMRIFMDKENIPEKYVKKIISGIGLNIIVINNDGEKTLLIGNIGNKINEENQFQLLYILNYKHTHDLENALERIKKESLNYIYNYLLPGNEEYLVSPIFNRKDMIKGYIYQYNESILYEHLDEYYLCENLKNVIELFNYLIFLNNKLQNWKGNNNKIFLSPNEYCIVNKKWVERFKKTFKYESISTAIKSGQEMKNITIENDKDNFQFTDKNIYTTLKSFNVDTLINYNKDLKEINLEKELDYNPDMERITYNDELKNPAQQSFYITSDFEILPKNIINRYIEDINQMENFSDCQIIDSFILMNFASDLYGNNRFNSLIGVLDNVSNSFEIKSVLVYYSKPQLAQILAENNLNNLVELDYKRFLVEFGGNYAYSCCFKYVRNSMNFNNGLDNFNNNNTMNNNNNIINNDNDINYDIYNNDNNNNGNDGLKEVNIVEYNLDYQPNYRLIKINFNNPPLIGLDNIGATCYMNATLQCFSNIEPFVNFFKYDQNLINKVRNEINNKTKSTLSSSFKLLIEKLWPNDYMNNPKKSYSPYEFKAKISAMNDLFKGVAANDSKDLVNFIIMTLHEELNEVQNKIIDTSFNLDQRDMGLMYNSFIQNFQANNKSEISRLFYAYNYNMTECQNCRTPSYNFQTYFFLIFPLEEIRKYKLSLNQMNNFNNIIDNNVVNIYDCLDYERKITVMDGTNMMYCNYCRLTCKSIMSTNLCTGPEILIIILNRGKGIQFDVKINFYEQLDLSQYIYMKDTGCYYNLIGVITHIGESGMGGHFIAYCRNPINYLWNKYNDSIVSPVNDFKSEVIDFAMPYLLFYQKNH